MPVKYLEGAEAAQALAEMDAAEVEIRAWAARVGARSLEAAVLGDTPQSDVRDGVA